MAQDEYALVLKHFPSPDRPQHEKYQAKSLLIPSSRKIQFQHIFINLLTFKNVSNTINISDKLPTNCLISFLEVYVAGVLSHFPPTFSSSV